MRGRILNQGVGASNDVLNEVALGVNSAPVPTTMNALANISVSRASQAVFNVILSQPATSAITLAFVTADGTAKAGTDYTATSGTLNLRAWANVASPYQGRGVNI